MAKTITPAEEELIREIPVSAIHLDSKGREIPSSVPVAPPVGYVKHKSIAEQMREMLRQASMEAQQNGAETEEEANDFDVGEDFDPHSPWEHDFEVDPEAEALIALMSARPRPGATASAGAGDSSSPVPADANPPKSPSAP